MGEEEGNIHTLDVNFTGELDFPEGQEPNEPNRDEEETEENGSENEENDQLNELDPSPENRVVLTSQHHPNRPFS